MTLPPGDTCKIWGQIWCHSWGWYWSQRCPAGMLHSPQCTGQHPKRNALSPTLGWRNNWNGEGQGCPEGSGQWQHPGRQGVTSEAASGWHLRGGPSCPGTGTAQGQQVAPLRDLWASGAGWRWVSNEARAAGRFGSREKTTKGPRWTVMWSGLQRRTGVGVGQGPVFTRWPPPLAERLGRWPRWWRVRGAQISLFLKIIYTFYLSCFIEVKFT